MDEHEKVITSGDAEAVKRESARRTRRSFVVGGVAAAAGYGLWRMVEAGPLIGRQSRVLRRTFQADAAIARGVFGERGLAPEYPLSKAKELRLNGTVGMDQTLKLDSWRLQLVGSEGDAASPRYVKDVTAWDYEYAGDMEADSQAADVKSAPGNTLGRSDDNASSKTGAKAGAPKEQRSSPGGKAGQADSGSTTKQEPGVGAGSGQPAKDGVSAGGKTSVPAQHGGVAKLTIEQRFLLMARAQSKKKNQGDGEAGPSASSLDMGTPGLLLTMDDLMKLPQVEHVFEFHCIEGWSVITQWGGVRLRDLIEAYPPAKVNGREPRYVYMETPDGDYYGGYDMSAARHPQSMLVTHMSGKPLTQEHGAPLRLFMPVKYGYKNLKRIGLIAYTDTKPDDYWTKLGYDWYAGL